MANNFQSGHACPVKFTAEGGGATATLDVTSHSLDISKLLFDTSHTGSGGNTGRTPGKRDVSGTVALDFDADDPPYLEPPDLVEGTSGIMLFFYSALALNRPIQVPVIIEKIHYETAVDNKSKVVCDVKMNCHEGSFVMPSS